MGRFWKWSYHFFSQPIIARPQANRILKETWKSSTKEKQKSLFTSQLFTVRLNVSYAGEYCDVLVEDSMAWVTWTIWGHVYLIVLINSPTSLSKVSWYL